MALVSAFSIIGRWHVHNHNKQQNNSPVSTTEAVPKHPHTTTTGLLLLSHMLWSLADANLLSPTDSIPKCQIICIFITVLFWKKGRNYLTYYTGIHFHSEDFFPCRVQGCGGLWCGGAKDLLWLWISSQETPWRWYVSMMHLSPRCIWSGFSKHTEL